MGYYFLGLISIFIFMIRSQGTMFDNPPSCDDFNQQISLEDDNRFLFVGEFANLTCSIYAGNPDNIFAENFYFNVKKNNTMHIPKSYMKKNSTHVEISTSDLIEYIPENPFYDYACLFNNTVAGDECVERKYIYFDFRPTPVKNFSCLISNWHPRMTCWGDLGVLYQEQHLRQHIEVNITVYVGIAASGVYALSPKNVIKNGTCLKMIIPEDYFNWAVYKVKIEIENTVRNIKNVSSYEFEPEIYVKPDKIKDFSHSQNATYIQLRWRYDSGMEKVFCVKYREKDSNDIWKEIDLEILNKSLEQQMIDALNNLHDTKEHSMLLSKLWPYTEYTITITVRPLIFNSTSQRWIQTGYWSDSYETTIQTKEDIPIAVPTFEPGYFSQIDDNTIEIYWKPISKREQCGNIQSYRVIMQEVVPFGEIENSTQETFPPDRISHQIQLDPSKKYNIKLTQKTKVGYPITDDAHIYVFPKDYRPKVSSFKVAAYNNTQIEITWETASLDDTNKEINDTPIYQIVWCYTSPDNCLEPLKSMNTNLLNATISLTKGHYSQYKFGISAVSDTKKGWFVSSGITWYNDCIYLLDGIPETPLKLEIPLDVDQEEGLYIKWTPYSCKQSIGEVMFYVVYFCQTDKEETKCKGQEDQIEVPPSSSSYQVKNLIEGDTYLLKIAAKMRNGQLGQWSNVERVLIGNKKSQRNEVQNTMPLGPIIGGVAGGVFIVIIIIIVMVKLRHYCKKADADAKEIHPPRIQKTPFPNTDINCSSSETRESRPLLKSNHSAMDSGLGLTTYNGNNTELSSLDRKTCVQNGVSGQHIKGPLLQNGSINHSTVIMESPCVSTTNDNINSETTFTTGVLSDDNSGHYTDVSLQDSDDDDDDYDDDELTSNNSVSEKLRQKPMIPNSIHKENKGFINENRIIDKEIDSNCIESYCNQGESSGPIDSYCKHRFDSGSGVNIT